MSKNKDLFKDAIADAKALREAALLNAKAALEETLSPRIQSMLSTKLQEMDGDDEDLAENEDVMSEDFDISEILAELEAEDTVDEVKKDKDAEAEDAEAEDAEADTEDDKEVKDMSVEELTDLVKSIVSAELGSEVPMDDMEPTDDLDGEMDAAPEMEAGDDEIDIEELLAELDTFNETDEELEEAKKAKAKSNKAMEDELKEAIETINILRGEINENNLLNTKLRLMSNIFVNKNLTESQKVRVVASFDKATTIKEAQLVFESLNTNIQKPAPKAIKESLGFASKASGMAPKKPIVETDAAITRMQKLANIIK